MSKEMKAKGAVEDYKKSVKRQIELYLWLQSKDGPFAGGCTNSKNGDYSKYDSSDPLFYDMAYVEHPVYADPGSNHWIGNQVWSTQRLAELYYYVVKDGDLSKGETYGGLSLQEALEALLDRWVEWFVENTQIGYTDEDGNELPYAIPSSLDWTGKPASWDGKYDPKANDGLSCKITAYGMSDTGCVSSLCNTLIYYAKAHNVPASAAMTDDNTDLAAKGLRLANLLMSAQWELARDEYGLAFEESNGSLKRVFEQEVFIPTDYEGTMPDGSVLKNGATFSSIRESYAKDPMYQELKKVYDADKSTEGYKYKLHRFWHMGDVMMTTGTMALLYPDVTPDASLATGVKPQPSTDPTDAPTDPTDAPTKPGSTATLYGDANCDGKVTLSDALAILQFIANEDKYPLTAEGQANADCVDAGKGITAQDAVAVQMVDTEAIAQSKLPITAADLK
jgi:hypothetical protein